MLGLVIPRYGLGNSPFWTLLLPLMGMRLGKTYPVDWRYKEA